MKGKLSLEDGSIFEGESFGGLKNSAGEVVFSTGMVGYPESMTDPSYCGQILVLTYPIIGSYGVFEKKYWESDAIQISGLIVSNYINTPSHFQSRMTLSDWLKKSDIPALQIQDTRYLTQKIRMKGTLLGKIIINPAKTFEKTFYDPNKENLVSKVSTSNVSFAQTGSDLERNMSAVQGRTLQDSQKKKRILLIDCGTKKNIERCLLKRRVQVITVPWNFDPFESNLHLEGVRLKFDGIVISNGPGDPKMAKETIKTIKKALDKKIPTLGICLGHQLLTLAAGGDTQKMKFGHRSQNQPCKLVNSSSYSKARPARSESYQPTRCYITTQNHGFAVNRIPNGFNEWFVNANDGTNEGIIHEKLPFMSVQFHPEAAPGPTDTEWIFDYFLKRIS